MSADTSLTCPALTQRTLPISRNHGSVPSHPSRALRFAHNPLFRSDAPTPSPISFKPIEAPQEPGRAAPALDHAAMLEARRAKLAVWATLDLRQDWSDAGWLRGHLAVAGLRVSVSNEPAGVARMKAKLRSTGVMSPEIQAAVGMTLEKYLKANPKLPLWVALAMVLEATGRFTPDAGWSLGTEPSFGVSADLRCPKGAVV